MISNNISKTPRPRPPAKARRTPSGPFKDSPPPPYAPAVAFPSDNSSDSPLDTLLGSSISMTAQRVRLLSGTSPLGTHPSFDSDAEDWMNEKSREELSELLLKADKAIRDRENELGLTSAVCKNLFQENANLKNKHEALMARLPASQPMSPIGTPSQQSTIPLPSPNYYSTSLPHSNVGSVSSPAPFSIPPHMRHHRKISVTPSEISRLADQNNELMLKLEKLETESIQADQGGKKKLRKLEKEIQLLRDELERTQARSEELENNATARFIGMNRTLGEQEAERKRKEREEKVRVMRGKTLPEEDVESEEIRDFAPGSALSAAGSPSVTPSARRYKDNSDFTFPSKSPLLSLDSPTSPSTSQPSQPEDDDVFSSSYFSRTVPQQPTPASLHESHLISQLLEKIRELEDTNGQILGQQTEAAVKMRAAQKDVEQIRRLYECLGDEVIVVDDDVIQQQIPGQDALFGWKRDKTITFKSLRKNIEGDDLKLFMDGIGTFKDDIRDDMHSTSRSVHSISHRTRKSLAGLFDDPTAASLGSSDTFSTTLAGSSPPFPPSDVGNDDGPSLSDQSRIGTPSPSPSRPKVPLPDLSFASTDEPWSPMDVSSGNLPRHTLGSELGSEYGDELSADVSNHHLKRTSLYDLSYLTLPDSTRPTSPQETSPVDPKQEYEGRLSGNSLDPSQLMQLPSPSIGPSQRNNHDFPSSPVNEIRREAAHNRNRLLSQTVRARTGRWVDGRFKQTLRSKTDSQTDTRAIRRQPSSSMRLPIPRTASLSKMFEGAVQTVFGAHAESTDGELTDTTAKSPCDQGSDGLEPILEVGRSVQKTENHQNGMTSLVLDLWLWLQFVIIIMVFLYAMAKRGPRNVLEEAERRRAGSASATRR